MYFVKFFGAGLDDNYSDPRAKIWAGYKCGLCGHETEYDVTSSRATFDIKRERRCPSCKQINAEDRETNLKAQLEKLVADKSRIEIEIEKVERELSETYNTKEC